MDRKAYARIDRLRNRRAKLKSNKDYVLSRIRKYKPEIQRAVVIPIWKEIAETERQIDETALGSANTTIVTAADGLISRTMPIGARYEAPDGPGPDKFGFWRATNSSLVSAFGALRADITAYIDDIPLPDLFVGPFAYNDESGNTERYMALLDEASAWLEGSGRLAIVPDILMPASRLSLREDSEHPGEAARYEKLEGDIQAALGGMIRARAAIGNIFRDAAGAYIAQRKLQAEYVAARYGKALSEKDMRIVKRLRKRFGIRE